jgi:hypothetical protein
LRCKRWGQSQILQLATHFVVGGQIVEICLKAEHRQHTQISAQGGTRIASLNLVDRSPRHACPLRHHGRAQFAAQTRQPQALARGGEQRLLLGENNGWFARYFATMDKNKLIYPFWTSNKPSRHLIESNALRAGIIDI